jgi:uncharacterized coiled-coil protein SlyX
MEVSMKPGVKNMWFVLIIVSTLIAWQPGWAQDAAMERVGGYGTIDWVGQKVIAKGIGAPPKKYYGKPQARPLALRAAVTDARRNLLEVIKGVHIDSVTRVNNYFVRDDTILTKVEGIVKNSSVDDKQYLSDGTVEVVVSMPLTGQLGETLIKMVAQDIGYPAETLAVQDVEARIQRLENRVKALEDQLASLKKMSLQQKQTILLFKRFVAAWLDYMASRPMVVQAGLESEDSISNIRQKLQEQESRLTALSTKLNEMAERLAALESSGVKPAPKPEDIKPKGVVYSGLVIDARKTGFRPCLKPKVFAKGDLIYPGDFVNMQKAVRQGYVRYYRQISPAQQSERAGKLPYTTIAKGTWQGKRSLEIGSEANDILKSQMEIPDNFLTNCKVIIVF